MATYRTDSVYRNTAIVNNEYLDVLDVSNIDVDKLKDPIIDFKAGMYILVPTRFS